RIGIIGFSAGGHLASTAATHADDGKPQAEDPVDRVSCRPDVQILIYPVITMGPGGHGGSKNNLLGSNAPAELVELLSNEKQVTAKTPPAFLVHSTKDNAVPVSNSDKYSEALKAAGVPYEYVRGEIGGHGFGLTKDWDAKCIAWLRAQKF
ncbi:MAG: alpha/beta hydrolase, partial [Planctomycetota bacterium]|nr:alpha/beta hydrolase [Planctomycetota bacterium]